MWIYRSLLALVGGSCLVILSAALTRTLASVAPTTAAVSPELEISTVPPAPPPQADIAAERCLDQAIELFKAERVNWLEMTIWQKAQVPGFSYEADGSYRLAPGQRFRLEMHTHPAEGEGTMLSVSDGQQLWRAGRSGKGPWENVTHINLSEVFAAMNGPVGQQLREEFLQRPHFQGMTPMLRHLRTHLVWAQADLLRQTSGGRIRLVGVWSKEEAMKKVAPNQPWIAALPRQCHLYLDARSYWPQRVEWWGPTTAGGPDRLLVQMEFRNPVLNRPLSADVCARLFAFHPGDAEVEDETATVTAELSKRAGELTQPSTPR
jgi:hypothetical protein